MSCALLLFLPQAFAVESLRITGTGSGIGTMQRMASAFQKKHPGVIIDVLPSIGSTGGIKAVSEGKIDIALSSRPLKREEQRGDLIEETYGKTPFVFAASASNPVKGVTIDEVEEIYGGSRVAWPDGRPIRLVLRPAADAYTVYLESLSQELKQAVARSHSIPGVFVGATDQDAANQLEKTPGSFGVTSLSLVKSEKKNLRVFALAGVPATPENLRSGKYPYALTLSVVYLKSRYKGALKDFMDFVYSSEGQRILADCGHVPVPRSRSRKDAG